MMVIEKGVFVVVVWSKTNIRSAELRSLRRSTLNVLLCEVNCYELLKSLMASNPMSITPYGIIGRNDGVTMRGTILIAADVSTLSPTGCG